MQLRASLVMNGSTKISSETSKRVLRFAEKLNYKPNSIAKSLKTKKTNTIGINEYADNNEYYIILNNVRLFKRIGNNYNDTHKYKKEIQDILQVLLEKQVDGIIYIGSCCRDVTEILGGIKKPTVFVYSYSTKDLSYSVIYDDKKAAYDATEYLISKGHRKIGLIRGLYESQQCQDRFKGYLEVLNKYNILYNPDYIKAGNWGYESGFLLAKELLGLNDPPTAIFSMNDLIENNTTTHEKYIKCKCELVERSSVKLI